MIARVLGVVLLFSASTAIAGEQSVIIKNNDVAVATLSVPANAKVTTKAGKTDIDTKTWTVHLWVVPASETIDKAVPKVGKVIESEVKKFVVDRTEKLTVAGAEAQLLIGKGVEADDGDPGSADVVIFVVGKHVLAACVHGEGETATRWRPAMLEVLKTVKTP